jgi:hypothetical protein
MLCASHSLTVVVAFLFLSCLSYTHDQNCRQGNSTHLTSLVLPISPLLSREHTHPSPHPTNPTTPSPVEKKITLSSSALERGDQRPPNKALNSAEARNCARGASL